MSGAMRMRRPLLVLLLCVAAAASADSQTLPRPGEVVDSNGRPIVIPPPRLIGPNGQVITNPQVGPIVGPGMPVPANLPTPPVAHPAATSGISDDGGITLNFAATNVDEIAARARAAGTEPLEGPVERPWNTRDVTFRDPDGNRINFTAPRRGEGRTKGETFEQVMARATDTMSRGASAPNVGE